MLYTWERTAGQMDSQTDGAIINYAVLCGHKKMYAQLPCPPVTLHQPPIPVYEDSIPCILKHFRLNLHPRLISDTFGMTFDLDTV
jgi:hypothetical protein